MRGILSRAVSGATDNLWIQLFRYFFVGGIAFVVDFSLLWVLTYYAGLHYLLSASVSFTVGLAVNYVISILWVFNRHTVSNRWAEFAIFAVIGVAGLGLNALIMWAFTDILGCHYLLSKLVSTAAVFAWNFGVRRFVLFNK